MCDGLFVIIGCTSLITPVSQLSDVMVESSLIDDTRDIKPEGMSNSLSII